MGDRTGQQFGNYRLTRLLGRGGFAEVYLGEHRRLQTQAAIKVLLTTLAQEDEDDFLKEARIVAHLEHPHIVRVLDFDVQESTPFLVMSYAPNGNIRRRHQKGTALPLPTIVDYVRQIADALQYAHNEKFIHRDIKPENILVGRRQELLLSDFGIAMMTQSSRLQSTQEVVGTAAYMAPEQFQGKPRQASDQYALGIIVYEWLCGTRPFHGSFTEIASQHMFVSPSPLRDKLPDLAPEVEQVVLTALSKDPTQRFATVQAFATALEQSSRQRPVFPSTSLKAETLSVPSDSSINALKQPDLDLALPPSSPPSQIAETVTPPHPLPVSRNLDTPPGSSTRLPDPSPSLPLQPTSQPAVPASSVLPTIQAQPSRRKVKRRVVIAGLATVALAGGGIYWGIVQNLPPPPVGTLLYTYRGHSQSVRAIAWSPDSQRIASGSADTTVHVWNAMDGSDSYPYVYRGHSDWVLAVAWSPDGKRIASASADTTVHVWTATDGSDLNIYKGHANVVKSVVWSPDSKRIASASDDKTVQIWNAADGSSAYGYNGHSNWVLAVAWSPDGKLIVSASADRTARLWNVEKRSVLYIYKDHASAVNSVAWSLDGKRIASGSDDSTVHVWNAADGLDLYIYKDHSSVVTSVAWSPDGRYIASASDDKTVQVWSAGSSSELNPIRSNLRMEGLKSQ